MCIIIYKQEAGKLPDNVIENSVRINPDGMGYLDLATGLLTRTQSTRKMIQLLRSDRPFISHCRFATVGGISRQGIHPFFFETESGKPNGWLFQNGTVDGFADNRSDSANIADMLRYVKFDSIRDVLESFTSRFLIYWDDGTVETFGEWIMQNGIAYSKPNVLRNVFTLEGLQYE